MENPVVLIVKEMGYTHADFFRLLPKAMGEHRYEINGLSVLCPLASGKVTITLGPEGERRLVLVVIPRTQISFEFEKRTEKNFSDTLTFVL